MSDNPYAQDDDGWNWAREEERCARNAVNLTAHEERYGESAPTLAELMAEEFQR